MKCSRDSRIVIVAAGKWPEDGIEVLDSCPVCGSSDRSILHRDLRDLVFHCAPGAWDMWRCGHCSNAYLDPRPTADTIVLAYDNYFTHGAPTATHRPSSRLARARRALANGYRNWRFGARLTPATALGVPVMLVLPILRNSIDLTMRHLPRPTGGRAGSVLDVGCGNGQFLDDARTCGWTAVGCDFDPAAVEIARGRGFEIREGGIDAWTDSADSFDAITFSHVIEHLHDPVGTLEQARRLLRAGGSLYVDTPNIDAAGHRHFGRAWRGLEPPRHLVLFNWPGMRRALEAAGFTGIRRVARPGVYGGIAAQSAAIRDGRDPARAQNDSLWADRVTSRLRDFAPVNQSEFITLVATRGED